MNTSFVDYVCGLLSDRNAEEVLRNIFAAVPADFWTAPASSSGKYHPGFALGEGGLVRHTLVCIHIARDLASAYDLVSELDVITIAAALHDSYKGGLGDWSHTVAEHPSLAADAMFDGLSTRIETGGTNSLPIAMAGLALEHHMSMWGTTPEAIGRDMNQIASLVATADYMASRKYLEPSAELAQLLSEY